MQSVRYYQNKFSRSFEEALTILPEDVMKLIGSFHSHFNHSSQRSKTSGTQYDPRRSWFTRVKVEKLS